MSCSCLGRYFYLEQLEELISHIFTGEVHSGVCVVESSSVSCFMDNGSEYLASLPFQVLIL